MSVDDAEIQRAIKFHHLDLPGEVRVWAHTLRRTELDLREAVKAVGNSAFEVQAYLRRKHERQSRA